MGSEGVIELRKGSGNGGRGTADNREWEWGIGGVIRVTIGSGNGGVIRVTIGSGNGERDTGNNRE